MSLRFDDLGWDSGRAVGAMNLQGIPLTSSVPQEHGPSQRTCDHSTLSWQGPVDLGGTSRSRRGQPPSEAV